MPDNQYWEIGDHAGKAWSIGKNIKHQESSISAFGLLGCPERSRKEDDMKRVLVSICAALIVIATGCQSNGVGSSSAVLAGTTWRLLGWSASSLDPSQFTITADFNESRVSGTSAVNSYGGPYSATASGEFSVGALQSTMMAGAEDAMRAEQIYLQLLGQARNYTVNEATLTLLGGGSNVLLVFTSR